MGYLKIDNLYKNNKVLAFKQVYALEKIHGTSAHISLRRKVVGPPLTDDGPQQVEAEITFFSGGEKHDNFVAVFDVEDLKRRFLELGVEKMVVFGEAYGGKWQGMKDTYGDKLKFVAFDVLMSDDLDTTKKWLGVEQAEFLVSKLGLQFVAWNLVDADIPTLDRERDLPSRQAARNGILEPKISEGIVIRPPIEVRTNNGERLIAKHKRPEFSERRSKRDTNASPEKLELLTKAQDIAEEWVTEGRAEHVVDKLKAKLGRDVSIKDTQEFITLMVEDVLVEGRDEIVASKEAIKAISSEAGRRFKRLVSKTPAPAQTQIFTALTKDIPEDD